MGCLLTSKRWIDGPDLQWSPEEERPVGRESGQFSAKTLTVADAPSAPHEKVEELRYMDFKNKKYFMDESKMKVLNLTLTHHIFEGVIDAKMGNELLGRGPSSLEDTGAGSQFFFTKINPKT